MLDFAMRCQAAGHDTKWHFRRTDRTKNFGKGLVTIIDDWREYARWADIIVLADNTKYLREVDAWRKSRGCLVVGATVESAAWELDRTLGQAMFRKCGIPVLPFKEFSDYDTAISYVKRENRRFVSKPCGDEPDKSLSYVAKSPADLVYMLTRWKKAQKLKGKFMLQEFAAGTEMAVGAWFGPDGFMPGWCENFEEKSLFPGGLGPSCFTPDGEVLTREGWKFWPDVTAQDEICTLIDGAIDYERPSKIVAEKFSGNLVGWQSPTVDILVTPGHQMYVQDDHYRKPFFFEAAGVAYNKRRTIMRAGGMWVGDAGAGTDSKAWAAFLGAYIADGSCKERSIVFGNCPPHKQEIFKKLAYDIGFEAKMYGPDLYVNSTQLVTVLRPLGYSHEKRVPQEIKNSRMSIIKAFLYGYGSGDGTRPPANLIYTTASKGLADDLQELCLKIGQACSIRTRDRRGESHEIKGYACINQYISYDVGVSSRTKAEISADNRYLQPYEGMVYCVTVSSHVIFTRRNGKACWIGQTGEMGTVLWYTATSKLARKVLAPLEDALACTGHTGYVDINCIIDENGDPWPLEATMRMGWPTFNIQQALHEGDPVEWLADLCEGRGGQQRRRVLLSKPCVGVVMALPDFPYSHVTRKEVTGVPIYLPQRDSFMDRIHPCEIMAGEAPTDINGKVVTAPCWLTSGDYVLVVTGTGDSIRQARESTYRVVDQIKIPASPFWRKDIGQRLAKCLPEIQRHGYATGLQY